MPYAIKVWSKYLVYLIFQSLIFSYSLWWDHEVLLNISMYHYPLKYTFCIPLFHIFLPIPYPESPC